MLSDDFSRAAAAAARLATREKDHARQADLIELATALNSLSGGIVLQTPDKAHTYLLGVDNAGALTITLVT